jgi:hypothetical protein
VPDLLGTAVSAEDAASLSLEGFSPARQCTDDDIERHNRDMRDLLASLFGDDQDTAMKRR